MVNRRMPHKPKIGVTLDYNTDKSYSNTPWYALRANYIESISNLGANVVLLHYEYDIENYAHELDGLVITGGNFDIDPKLYGQAIAHERVNVNSKRTKFEYKICSSAIDRRIPILGICGGLQLLNVKMGGSLIQHIPQEIESTIDHEQKIAKHLPSHPVQIIKNSRLYQIVNTTEMQVNSTHHQAIKNLAKNFIINCVAPDGIIEGIELNDSNHYILGVQWHPEYCYSKEDKKIMLNFVEECQKYP